MEKWRTDPFSFLFRTEGELAQRMIFALEQFLGPGLAVVATGLPGQRAVVGQLVRVDTGQQFGAPPDVEHALAQQRAQGAFSGRVDEGRRDQVGAEQVSDFLRVDAVVLVFATVDEVEVERVGQDEGEVGLLAGVSEPVPAEHAFGADAQAVSVRSNELEEVLEVVVLDVAVDQLVALAVHEADVHLPGVQVDSAVVFRGGGVVFHSCLISGVLRTPVIV